LSFIDKVLLLGIALTLITAFFLVSAYSSSNRSSSESSNSTDTSEEKSYSLNLTDPNLRAELVVKGLRYPTSMTFLGKDDMLVLEKETGTVKRIVNGQMLENPVIDVNVYGLGENGLLGTTAVKNNSGSENITNVFLFFSESKYGDTMNMTGGETPLGNRLYKYEFVNNTLTNPQLILDLPYSKIDSPMHNGGKIVIGPDHNLYVTSGDLGDHYTEAQNAKGGDPADGSSGVLGLQQNGQPTEWNGASEENGEEGILGSEYPLNLYYGYGIRNSFGMDFDPMTENLWITDNGPDRSDEINLVRPGFNGGYDVILGLAEEQDGDVNDLVDYDGKGEYGDPKFVWGSPIGVTAIKFLNSIKYGDEYENDILVGDFNYGNIYHFDLDEGRENLILQGNLTDKTAGEIEEMNENIFARGPGAIVDIQIGPDGYLYVLSLLATVTDCDPDLAGCVVDSPRPLEGVVHRIVPIKS
jgi:glucose/arabinose dehydrogenase